MSNLSLDALVDVRRAQWGGGARPRALTPVVHPYLEVHHSAVAGHYDRVSTATSSGCSSRMLHAWNSGGRGINRPGVVLTPGQNLIRLGHRERG